MNNFGQIELDEAMCKTQDSGLVVSDLKEFPYLQSVSKSVVLYFESAATPVFVKEIFKILLLYLSRKNFQNCTPVFVMESFFFFKILCGCNC